jgi:hypothetical protein
MDETEVLEWMTDQKNDASIEEIDREILFKYIETKEFLAVVFCTSSLLPRSFADCALFQTKKKIRTVRGSCATSSSSTTRPQSTGSRSSR